VKPHRKLIRHIKLSIRFHDESGVKGPNRYPSRMIDRKSNESRFIASNNCGRDWYSPDIKASFAQGLRGV
jgi:hypothetical protein